MKNYDYQIVAVLHTVIEAELLKHRLENAGIETTLSSAESSSFVYDDNKVKVYVANKDFEAAKAIADSEPDVDIETIEEVE